MSREMLSGTILGVLFITTFVLAKYELHLRQFNTYIVVLIVLSVVAVILYWVWNRKEAENG